MNLERDQEKSGLEPVERGDSRGLSLVVAFMLDGSCTTCLYLSFSVLE